MNSSNIGLKFTCIAIDAVEVLGLTGRMLYKSKSMKKPTTIFNANIFNAEAKKVWFGDLEIERDRESLIELSRRLGPIYILWESDGRFLRELPTIGYVKSVAAVAIQDGEIWYSEDFDRRVKFLTEKAALDAVCPKSKKRAASSKTTTKGDKL